MTQGCSKVIKANLKITTITISQYIGKANTFFSYIQDVGLLQIISFWLIGLFKNKTRRKQYIYNKVYPEDLDRGRSLFNVLG